MRFVHLPEYLGEAVPNGSQREKIQIIKKALASFFDAGQEGLTWYFEEEFKSHKQAEKVGTDFFELFKYACAEFALGSNASHELVQELLNISTTGLPSAVIKVPFSRENTLFCFLMNNLYPKQHPRYSPVPALVVTRFKDIDEVLNNKPELVDRIKSNTIISTISAVTGRSVEKLSEELAIFFTPVGENFQISCKIESTPIPVNLIYAILTVYDNPLYTESVEQLRKKAYELIKKANRR